MSPLSILIIGAGVAGPCLASLLQRANPAHSITIVERAPALRASGLQLDFKLQGMPIMRKMGLLDEMRKHRVEETGNELVGAKGERLAHYGVKTDDAKTESSLGLTNEIEIMRGDIVRVLYEHGLKERAVLEGKGVREGGLRYEFGKTVEGLEEKAGTGVDVRFSDGQTRTFDVVVGADGQNSRTRTLAFEEQASREAFKELGTEVAYFTIPRGGADNALAKLFVAPYKRAIMLRNGDRPTTQIYLFSQNNAEKIKASYKKPVEEQKDVWAETFQGAGWDTERFLAGMRTANDFYTHQLAQVKLSSLYKGRVVLIGDAGYCPSVLTGKGTTSALIGAYVLAGELARQSDNVDAALKSYNDVMREPVELCQQLNAGITNLPSSPLTVWLLRNSIWAVSTLKIDKLLMKLMPEKKNDETGLAKWKLPEYPELKLAE